MDKMEAIQASLRIAEDWALKGQPAWAIKSLSAAVTSYLGLAGRQFLDDEAATAWLSSHGVEKILDREAQTLKELARLVDAGTLPAAAIGGNYSALAHAHLAWALGEYEVGNDLVRDRRMARH